MTNPDQYQLPELPPLEKIIDQLDKPRRKTIEQESRSEERTESDLPICPILQRRTGDGTIQLLRKPFVGGYNVVCEYIRTTFFGNKNCIITGEECPYTK